MTNNTPIEIRLNPTLADIPAAAWDACAQGLDPFTTHRFLLALEESGSVGQGSGWQPLYLTAHLGDQIIGCAPLYGKSHSQGEYIFDFNWAHAYEQAGGRYYPKFQIAVPFTPATGRRFLTHPEYDTQAFTALVQGAVQLASEHGVSSLHATFCTEAEAIAGAQMGLMRRTTQQFHWLNKGFNSFDDFLSTLASRKRKNIRKERARAQAFGGTISRLTGDEITPEHWDAFWQFYQDTGQRKWGTPYLSRSFFDIAQETLRDDMILVIAERDGQPVAGALNFIGQQALFGRYWGCIEDHPCLHFELCYYQAIEAAIELGLPRVEAGAQGEHKLARGYLPTACHSLHWIADEGFSNAVAQYLTAETEAIGEEIEILTGYGPFKSETADTREEQD
ncbi:GNAT family N-acetyltransferase [Lentibacter algarum]|uniref:GNAT family N-acetyltransferase n=1 Tax=Lentibacter algarum TaxID=576131 RepID=UPI001C098E27|nr:GNAT family N-acetyltransferase [Lentibacter algarum]MBU2983022.1 GNAT family N-acetyltransferase [Lentibacter algarum]